MNSANYVLDRDGEPVPEPDILRWAAWFETADRIVAHTMIAAGEDGQVHVCVSTVFLGVDHRWFDDGPPLLWETMVFGPILAGGQRRYSSRLQAEAGHERVVALCRSMLKPARP